MGSRKWEVGSGKRDEPPCAQLASAHSPLPTPHSLISLPHDFVIVIPVADRPQHLADCLASLAELMRRHPYGGRVSVLIADDSREPGNIDRHRALAEVHTREGLQTHHLDQAEQRALVEALPPELRARLAGVIGDTQTFHHKGASLTRNIAYLWLRRLQQDGRRRLFWFIDSDQEFRVNVEAAEGETQPYAIDYLRALDRIFRETPTRILTGKVVGDPPVSPAVMAGHFLDDVLAFLIDLAALAPQAACTFHGAARHAGDAAYHDMAELFGFKPAADAWRLRCPLAGAHDHAACLAGFAARLSRFFDGEHPTRRGYYRPADLLVSVQPARTVYTGNYVLDAQGLDHFIPFAALKLRMAGPTLGRIIRAELGAAFVSANLPMLHKRTVEAIGRSEFRPGIERASHRVDLSAEFERQYFGDVMLFAMERLTEQGYPGAGLSEPVIARAVEETEARIHGKYLAKHAEIARKIERLDALFADTGRWWHADPSLAEARGHFRRFIDNLRRNFGDAARAWQRVDADGHRRQRKAEIIEAMGRYPDEREAWRQAMQWRGSSAEC